MFCLGPLAKTESWTKKWGNCSSVQYKIESVVKPFRFHATISLGHSSTSTHISNMYDMILDVLWVSFDLSCCTCLLSFPPPAESSTFGSPEKNAHACMWPWYNCDHEQGNDLQELILSLNGVSSLSDFVADVLRINGELESWLKWLLSDM